MSLEKSLRIAVPSAWNNDEKGAFLETLANDLLRRQSYETTSRIAFTGMEIDLLAVHKPSGDDVYIECKFNESTISANVIDLMVGQAFRRRLRRLALFSASPLSKGAKGALEDLKKDDRISFAYYAPEIFLTAMEDSGEAPKLPSSLPVEISHATLFIYPYFEYVWLLQEQHKGRPRQVLVFSHTQLAEERFEALRSILDENDILEGLPIAPYTGPALSSEAHADTQIDEPAVEVVSQIATADNLIDYRPCRPSDFVGRIELQKDVWSYLGNVREHQTNTRIFALVGDSGFGKSSLVAKLAERFRNIKWRHKYFLFPVDIRSARGPLFVTEALLCAIQAAVAGGFLAEISEPQIDDADNLLASPSIQTVLHTLRAERKVLVIFFDQFEEVFTKDELFPVFRAFRRFALDASALTGNLVLGFSWRTGISLSDTNPAYQLWNELRDHRLTKVIGPFDSTESSRLITQFEKELGQKLIAPLRRQLHEQGQGLPWFLKKLCIHVYNQIENGASQVDLVGSRLNVQYLFDEDLRPLTESQVSCLRYIAENSPADSMDVYERYKNNVIKSLIDRRLIVRAGQRLAVYWDIFRDYLTEGKVPHIPWTYIPNSTISMSLSVCAVLANNGPMSTSEIASNLGYSEKTIINIITDLQNLVICGKTEDAKHCLLQADWESWIPQRMRDQFSEHIIYQALLHEAEEEQSISQRQGVQLVRELYSSANVKSATRDRYLSRLLPWFEFAGLAEPIPGGIRVFSSKEKGPGFGNTSIGRRYSGRGPVFLAAGRPEDSLAILKSLCEGNLVSRQRVKVNGWRNAAADLIALGLTTWQDESLQLAPALRGYRESIDPSARLREAVSEAEAMKLLDGILSRNDRLGRAEIGLELATLLSRDWKRSSAVRYTNGLFGYREFFHLDAQVDSTSGQGSLDGLFLNSDA